MTDSMKFGPEWLRNMSSDTTSSGGLTSTGSGGGGSSNVINNNTNNNNNNNNNISNNLSTSSSFQSTTSVSNRFQLAEYRYGREEMLSLYDKNLKKPDILPNFKKLFVERLQQPLALTPSTDDDFVVTNSTAPTTRAWNLRSPVLPIRGATRGAIADRGRGRTRAGFHSTIGYQRPTPLYDEEIRGTTKVERMWPERNGGNEIGAIDYGSPSSSPRKEYNSHSRTGGVSGMENWRRTRIEDDAAGDGWRGSSIGTNSNNSYRWSRSTSWRDDDTTQSSLGNSGINSGGGGSGTLTGNSDSSNSVLTRSFSSSAAMMSGTSLQDRSSSLNNNNNVSSDSGGGGNNINNFKSTLNTHTNSNSQPLSNKHQGDSGSNSWDTDDMLPEWAMENPTDGGGSFDASGAFHAPNEDGEESGNKITIISNESETSSETILTKQQDKNRENNLKNQILSVSSSSIKQKDLGGNKTVESNKITIGSLDNKEIKSEENAFTEELKSQKLHNQIDNCKKIEIQEVKKLISNPTIPLPTSAVLPAALDHQQKMPSVHYPSGKTIESNNDTNKSLTRLTELSDLMKEVADDMVEKLIMDDESSLSKNRKISSTIASSLLKNNSVKSNSPTTSSLLQQPLIGNPLMAPPPPSSSQTSAQQTNIADCWFYRDPQGKVQGPFNAHEMSEWYRAGYFDENLFVRRSCDLRYSALGELVKMCGNSVPFMSSHLIPPLAADISPIPHVSQSTQPPPSVLQQVGINASKSNTNSLLNTNDLLAIRLHQLQKQYLLQQQNLIINKLSGTEPWSLMSAEQQQALVEQHLSQISLPDNLLSTSSLNSSMNMINPSTYNLQQMFNAKNNINPNAKVNQTPIHGAPPSYSGDYSSQSTAALNNLMQNNVVPPPIQSNLGQQSSCPIENDPIKSFFIQLHMQKNANVQPATTTNAPPPSLPNKWSSSGLAQQPVTQWHATGNTVGNAVTPNIQTSMWDYVPMTQPKSEIKTEQQIIEEHIHHQNEKLVRQAHEMMKSISERNEFSSEINEHQLQKQQQQQHHQQQLQQLQQHQIAQSQTQSLQQQALNKKAERIKPEEKPQKNQKTDDDAKKSQKGNKTDKKDSKKVQITEEERKKEAAEDKRKQKEEKKRQQMEEEKRRQQQQEEEKRKQMLEEKKRLEEIEVHRRAKMMENSIPRPMKQSYASSIAPWSNSAPGVSAPGPNFAEIQKAEMERRAEEQRLEQLLEHQRKSQIMEMMMQKENNALKWNAQPLKPLNVKSLAEIQAEEHKRQLQSSEQQQTNSTSIAEQLRRSDMVSTGQSLGALNNAPFNSIWNNRPSVTQNSVSSAWLSKAAWNSTSNAGFWEEPTTRIVTATTSAKQSSTTNSSSRALTKSQTVSNMQSVNNKNSSNIGNSGNTTSGIGNSSCSNINSTNTNSNNNNIKTQQGNKQNNGKGKGGDKNSKPLNSSSSIYANSKKDDAQNEFTNWCTKTLSGMNSNVDVPTFIVFLQDIESPYEVKDYVRSYLGETKECTEFAKQYLERRSKYKNQQRAQNAHIDDMCQPAPAINPSSNDFQEVKGKGKKIKKSKMTKLDTRILGFSVTAAQDRINVGDRDYGDAS